MGFMSKQMGTWSVILPFWSENGLWLLFLALKDYFSHYTIRSSCCSILVPESGMRCTGCSDHRRILNSMLHRHLKKIKSDEADTADPTSHTSYRLFVVVVVVVVVVVFVAVVIFNSVIVTGI